MLIKSLLDTRKQSFRVIYFTFGTTNFVILIFSKLLSFRGVFEHLQLFSIRNVVRVLRNHHHGFDKNRSSHQRCPVRKGVLRNFATFTRKHLCQSLYFNKVAGLRPATLLKNRLWHRYFPVNFAKFLRTPFLQYTSGRLLLQ